MSRELLRNIGQKIDERFMQLPDGVRIGLLVPVICGIGVHSLVYSAIRGRFDRVFREDEIQWMQEETFFRGDSWLTRFPSVLWSRTDKSKVDEKIQEALALREARDAWFDSMDDEEMRAYVLRSIECFQEAIRPMAELEMRRN